VHQLGCRDRERETRQHRSKQRPWHQSHPGSRGRWTLGEMRRVLVSGSVFRTINKGGKIGESVFSPTVIWGVMKAACSKCGLDRVAPHDLRRTCAHLCHEACGELEQIPVSSWSRERADHRALPWLQTTVPQCRQ
jgi:integrase